MEEIIKLPSINVNFIVYMQYLYYIKYSQTNILSLNFGRFAKKFLINISVKEKKKEKENPSFIYTVDIISIKTCNIYLNIHHSLSLGLIC